MRENPQDKLQPWQAGALDTYAPGIMMPAEAPPPDRREYGALFFRRRWLMLGVLLFVFGLGMLYTFTRRPIYESYARIVVASSATPAPVAEGEAPLLTDLRALTRSRSVDTQVEMISSPELLREAFESLGPEVRSQGFGTSEMPEWAAKVAARRSTDIIVVTGRAYTPAAAAALANTVANVYFRRDLERNSQATRQARKYAGEQMAVAERQLAYATRELAAYKKKTGLFAPDEQLAKAAEQVVQLSSDLETAKAQLAAEQRQAAAMKRELSGERQNVVTNQTTAPNPQYDSVLERIDDLNSQRAMLLQEYTVDSREVRDIEERIRLERDRLRQIAATTVSSTVNARNPVRDSLLPTYAGQVAAAAASSARVRALESALAEKRDEARSLPESERGLADRVQKVAILQHTYETLSNKYNTLLLTEQATLPTGMLVSSARADDEPAYPSRGKNAVLFLLVGMLVAVAAAVVVEHMDRRVHDEQSAEQMTHLPSLSIIPRVSDGSPLLIASGGSNGAMLESFRILRNSISLRGEEEQPKVIAVTSPGRQEGKSTTSVNLAIAMAMDGKRVLLVDADMRRPSLHRLLEIPNSSGLSTLLTGRSALSSAISATKNNDVYCLPAGPVLPNPGELLHSRASRELFDRLGREWDTVVVDCPPAAGLGDVQVISTLVDGVLLVVSMSQTLKPQLGVTIRALRQAGASIIGVVLNRMDTRHSAYGYYDYFDASVQESEAVRPSM